MEAPTTTETTNYAPMAEAQTDVNKPKDAAAPTPDVEARPMTPEENQSEEVPHRSALTVANFISFVFGIIAISCLAAQLDGQWSDRNSQATFALVVACVFIPITGLLMIHAWCRLHKLTPAHLRKYFMVEALYHFVAMVFWFTAATVAAVYINSSGAYWYWNIWNAIAEARAYVAFAYLASFAEACALIMSGIAVSSV